MGQPSRTNPVIIGHLCNLCVIARLESNLITWAGEQSFVGAPLPCPAKGWLQKSVSLSVTFVEVTRTSVTRAVEKLCFVCANHYV